jgi:hypothetical protein
MTRRKRTRNRPREDPMRMTRETVRDTSNLMVGMGGLVLSYGVFGSLLDLMKK